MMVSGAHWSQETQGHRRRGENQPSRAYLKPIGAFSERVEITAHRTSFHDSGWRSWVKVGINGERGTVGQVDRERSMGTRLIVTSLQLGGS